MPERAERQPQSACFRHLVCEDARRIHDLARRPRRVQARKRSAQARELRNHGGFLRSIRRDRAREIADGRRAILRDRAPRITLRAREAVQAVRDEQPHRVRTPEIHPVRVSTQVGAVRLERGLKRKHSYPRKKAKPKIGYRALSHKDALPQLLPASRGRPVRLTTDDR